MAAAQQVYPKGLDFGQVWAALMEDREQQKETARQIRETQKETDRQIRESREETDRLLKENSQQIKEVGKRLGNFTNSFGDIAEHMIAPNLQEKFLELGLDFQEASNNHKIRDKKNDIKFEIDVYLQNGDIAMLVEIKADLAISDINDHLERLNKMRQYADLRGDKRRFLGAVAGIVIKDKTKEYALKNGFFLIEPNGENFNITSPYDRPKEW